MQEVLDGREQLHRVEEVLLQILRDTPREFPDALQDKFGDFGFLGVGSGAICGERFYDP